MRKILIGIVIVLFVFLTPYVTIQVMERYKVHPIEGNTELPKNVEPKTDITKPEIKEDLKLDKEKKKEYIPSKDFMTGYWEGYNGKKALFFRWSSNEDYRQGHMLGAYDKKNNIERYEKPKNDPKEPKKD